MIEAIRWANAVGRRPAPDLGPGRTPPPSALRVAPDCSRAGLRPPRSITHRSDVVAGAWRRPATGPERTLFTRFERPRRRGRRAGRRPVLAPSGRSPRL